MTGNITLEDFAPRKTDRALVALLPWVTRLGRHQGCDAYRWRSMPFKVLRNPVAREEWKCKKPARWKFEALPEGTLRAESGVYCWAHLGQQLGCLNEQNRIKAWQAGAGPQEKESGDA